MSIWSDLKLAVKDWLHNPVSFGDDLGQRGELEAARFLKKAGLRVVEHSYRNHVGEIDLIAVDKKTDPRTVVFVEVKTRQSDIKGMPVEAVNDSKQQQITETAMVFLKQNHLLDCRVRFDIVGVLWPDQQVAPDIRHFENAFEPTGQGQMFQ